MVVDNVLIHSPEAIIVVFQSMDTMTYLALKSTGLPKTES
jgi:malate dehydrogenase